MANAYLACFIIGLALSVLSFLTGVAGHSFGHFGNGGHGGDFGSGASGGHGGHGAHAAHGSHGGDTGVPLVNFGTATAFLTWFGGIGFLLTAYSRVLALATVGMALVGGVVGAGAIFFFMAKVLAPDQIPMDPSDYYLPGTLGRVTVTIPPEGTGEMVYTQGGSRKTVAARDAEGQGIFKGTEVVVLRYERGVAYVRPWEQVAEDRGGGQKS